ncbi:MAG: hypothetical protein JWM16_2049 [Verrucomicrobiales bacterium]|nr:hypothetical protein [Verrucomicrobiales bacterium]
MKIKYYKPSAVSGSAILMVVVITALAAIVLAAYLGLVSRQNYSTVRSQAWNSTIPVIEAGIEDAMAHLNAHGSTNLNCDDWRPVGGLYVMRRDVGDNYYVVTISNFVAGASNNNPMIDSRGYVSMPVQIASSHNTMLAAAGVSSGNGIMARGIRVATGKNALFAKGLVAKGQIDMNGNNIATDSFDSSDPNYSVGGKYSSAKRKDNGDVATNSGLVNSVNVGNADILGHISTGPGGSVSIGPNGSVGDLAWGGANGVKPGWVKDDMNIIFPDVKVPFTGGAFSLSGGSVGGTSYDYVLGNGNYQASSLSMGSKDKMIVTGTNTVLYVTGDFSMGGQSTITIAAGASLKLYVAGSSGSIGGNGVINPGAALNFIYYGLPSNTSLSFSGNAAFTGVIYAPNATFTMNGGGSSTYDFVGASITKTVTMNGHFNFHYDEALSKYGPARGFVVTSWNEMSPQEVAGLAIE